MLGEGSMGSVACVRKKQDAVGGSAYTIKKKNWFGRKLVVRKNIPMDVLSDSRTKLYALKSIILSRVSNDFIEELRNEIRILQSLDHPNIVKAYEVYESKVNLYVVLQHCSGGDLYARVPYSEKDSAKIVGKLMSAVAYMHAHNVCHRDIKFENIMFESNAPDAEIKLIDFGLSKAYSPEKKFMSEGVGTIYTMAPQVLRGVYTSQADNWSIGVVTYMLLSSTKPFYGKKRRHVVNKILNGEYSFYSKAWNTISQESKEFVSALLQVDSKKRMTAKDALAHPWLNTQFALSDRLPTKETMESIHESIISYASTGEFKKMALMVIAHQSTTNDISELRKVFDAYDTGNDGTITYEEFYQAIKSVNANYTDADIEQLFKSVDTGNDDKIYYLEFLAATLEARGRITEERLADAFDRIDSDDSGAISRENLKELLGSEYSEEKINAFLDEVDTDGDGSISFEEFLKCFQEDQRKQVRTFRPEFGESGISSNNSSPMPSTRSELLEVGEPAIEEEKTECE
jgi:serine/threonine protein kinase